MITEMIRYVSSCVSQICGKALSAYVSNALVAACVRVVSGCVSASHYVNETWSIVLVSVGSRTAYEVTR